MRRALIALLAGVVLGLGAAPALAADRFDVLAAMLRERPLAIDPELGWLFDAREERRILRALEGSPVPIFAAAVPQIEEDESGGDPDRIAAELHRRLGRPGLYVLIDARGDLETLAFDVPRSGAQGYNLRGEFPPENERGPAFTAARVEELVDRVVALPPGTTIEAREPRPLDPYEPTFSRRYDDDEPASFGNIAVGAGTVFGVLGLLAGGSLRLLEGRNRRREEQATRVAAERLEKRRRRQEQKPRQGARRRSGRG